MYSLGDFPNVVKPGSYFLDVGTVLNINVERTDDADMKEECYNIFLNSKDLDAFESCAPGVYLHIHPPLPPCGKVLTDMHCGAPREFTELLGVVSLCGLSLIHI